jgi:hypothetical protein
MHPTLKSGLSAAVLLATTATTAAMTAHSAK